MLKSLHVKNIALIDDVEIDFTKGLNILTGETGAGKSILIDSVSLALGGKLNKDVVRADKDSALCELVFSVEDDRIRRALRNLDIELEDDEVILTRKITSGKSTCKINGETVPASLSREAASYLIDVHGQHEHESLLHKKNHRHLLDEFCGDDFRSILDEVSKSYTEYKKVAKEYDEALASTLSKDDDLDYSQFVVNEIESARIRLGEDEELEERYSLMNNSKRIAEALSLVQGLMSSDQEGASSLIGRALVEMRGISSFDKGAGELYEQLEAIEDLTSDFLRGLYTYEDGLEFSAEEFDECETRLNELNRLKMKYGQSLEQILKRMEEESDKINKLNDFDSYINNLLLKKDESYAILVSACEKLSKLRKKEAKKLSDEIVAALNNLNFLDARFEICVNADEKNISSSGYDDVEFMISTNPGEGIKPITQVASGGELSRIMLALKSVLAKRDAIETLIFDEIDTGISGKTAQRVADRMSEIAKSHQVICITHLPQICSHATSHFLIQKSVNNGHTSTMINKLNYEESVEELSRMLAGEEITENVRNNASEMKKAAMLQI